MRTFILADNQYISRQGIRSILYSRNLADTIYQAENLVELQKYLKSNPKAVVILDYSLFDFLSIEHLLVLIEATKDSFWVLFSEELSLSFINRVSYAASVNNRISIILKHDHETEIITALEDAIKNVMFICETIKDTLNHATIPAENLVSLTKTEKIILGEIAKGKTTKQIALDKYLSFHTVNSHRKNIFRKLEVNNMQEAIRYAIRAGLIDTSDYYI